MKKGIENSLDLIDFQFDKGVQKIVIKPNMCYYWDCSTGQTTDPKFVAATIEILREKVSPEIYISIVESDASAMKCIYVFKFLGYQKIAKEYDVKLVNLSKVEAESVGTRARATCDIESYSSSSVLWIRRCLRCQRVMED